MWKTDFWFRTEPRVGMSEIHSQAKERRTSNKRWHEVQVARQVHDIACTVSKYGFETRFRMPRSRLMHTGICGRLESPHSLDVREPDLAAR